MSETDPNKTKEKELRYKEIRRNENYPQALNEADIWTFLEKNIFGNKIFAIEFGH